MPRDRPIPPDRHLSEAELEQQINEELDARVQQRLIFIRNLYRGDSIETAAKIVGESEATGRQWLHQWNKSGIEGLISPNEADDSSLPQLTQGQQATVEYLNYEVLDDYGWDLDDDDLFEKAAEEDLDNEDYGTIVVDADEYILDAAEEYGFSWPYACRGGACANCSAILKGGEIDIHTQQILPEEAIQEKNARLTCIGSPAAEDIKLVYNAKHEDYLQELVLPPQQVKTDSSERRNWFKSLFR